MKDFQGQATWQVLNKYTKRDYVLPSGLPHSFHISIEKTKLNEPSVGQKSSVCKPCVFSFRCCQFAVVSSITVNFMRFLQSISLQALYTSEDGTSARSLAVEIQSVCMAWLS